MKNLLTALLCGLGLGVAQADQPPVSFDVLEFVVEGNTVLPPDVVERTLMPHMGPGKTLRDVEQAREALERAYQDAGYLSVVVSLPNQQIKADGELRLQVIEARIESLAVSGAQHNRPSLIREKIPSLAPGAVPYFPQVQQEMAAVQNANMQVTPVLTAGSQPDLIQMDLKVEDKPATSASLELNNNQSFGTSRGRLSAVASYSNLFQLGHRVSAAWQYAPWRPDDTNSLTFLYGLPLSARDDLTLSVTRNDSSTPVRAGDGGNTLTKGSFYGLSWSRSLPARSLPLRHSLNAALDIKHNDDQTVLNEVVNTAKPALRYGTVSLGYALTWAGAPGSTFSWATTAVTSNGVLSARKVDCDGRRLEQFECKRNGARTGFVAWKHSLDFSGALWGNWRANAVLDAQLASGPLVSGEQYTLGGADTVRGYYDYEQAGDAGWFARLELLTPPWALAETSRLSGVLFFDRGFVTLQQALEGQVDRAQLGSWGLGLRLQLGAGTQFSVDAAKPTFATQRAESDGLRPTTDQSWRLHVRAIQSF